MLDVGLYRLDQQAACQRIDNTRINATSFTQRIANVANSVKAAFAAPAFAPAVA